ncbi:MAG: ABC transporter ATP-binding protein [Deltaproteobacteria bacterium]|nr:ABC transporter ATP-binding protein [Deltaproteobacteria bacterium]
MSDLIQVENLHKSFLEGGKEIHVLQGLDLQLGEGERMAIVGDSGVGKSTLLHILGTLDHPTSGRVVFRGRDLSELSDEEISHLRNQEIGFVFQFHYLLPDFSALENIMLPALIRGWEWKKASESAVRLLEMVGLKDRAAHRPGKLSGGEQQRVAVARSLILEPRLILADEPTGDLDPHTGAVVEKLLFRLNSEKGVGLVIATHNQQLAGEVGRRVELRNGRLFPL